MVNTKTSKTARVLSFLKKGNDITEGQAAARFGIRNMSAVASYLRRQGYAIYCNRKTFSNGQVASVYKHGAASRKVIAAGYRALAA